MKKSKETKITELDEQIENFHADAEKFGGFEKDKCMLE